MGAGGPPVTVTMSSPGEDTQLQFNGTAGERVNLAVSASSISAAQVSISKPGGGSVAATYAGTSGGFVDTKILPVTGVYTILVDPLGSATGSLTLTLYDVPADAGGTITPGGASSSISISTPGQNGRVTFTGAAGERISLNFTNASFSLALASILNADGSQLVSNRYIGTSGGFIDATTLPAAGTYSIVLDPQGPATGSATLTLYDVPPDAGGPITAGGASVTASTSVPGQNVRLTFSGTAGQRVSMGISSVTFSSAYASLLGPDGSPVGGSTFFGPGFASFMDTRTLPSNGTYAIVVDPPGTATGSATFTLYNVPPDITGTIAPGGAAARVDMGTPGQNAKLTFSGTAGQRISLNIGSSSFSSGYMSIANPDGSSLVNNTLFATTPQFVDTRTLPATGTYTVTIDPQGSATGGATFTLYDVPPDASGTLTAGAPALPVSLSTPGQNARL